jgi:predicted dehydrogenase
MMNPPPVRIGVIGCGLIAQRSHFPAYAAAPEASIEAVVSLDSAEAEDAVARFGAKRILPSWEAAVADPGIDAIDICTPNYLHAPIAIAAARAGKHVFVEKPMATRLEDADEMVQAARENGVHLTVGHNLRFAPIFQTMHEAMQEHIIGRPFAARAVYMHAGPDEAWGSASPWFWDATMAGGGALLDMGIHIIDALRWIIGRRVLEVSAMTSRQVKPTFADDTAFVLLRFEDDVVASVQAAWSARPTSDRELVIHGEEGNIAMGRSSGEPLVYNLRTEGRPARVVPDIPAAADPDTPYLDFVRSIQQGLEPAVPGEEGRDSLAIVLAAYESARSGHTVRVERSQ